LTQAERVALTDRFRVSLIVFLLIAEFDLATLEQTEFVGQLVRVVYDAADDSNVLVPLASANL